MTVIDELRRMLTEAGVEWEDMSVRPYACTSWLDPAGEPCTALEGADDIPDGKLSVQALLTPEQAITATVGMRTCRKVYLVETSDDLYEGWYPMTAYLHRESAEDCAEALRKKEGGIWQFARVSELKVVDA